MPHSTADPRRSIAKPSAAPTGRTPLRLADLLTATMFTGSWSVAAVALSELGGGPVRVEHVLPAAAVEV